MAPRLVAPITADLTRQTLKSGVSLLIGHRGAWYTVARAGVEMPLPGSPSVASHLVLRTWGGHKIRLLGLKLPNSIQFVELFAYFGARTRTRTLDPLSQRNIIDFVARFLRLRFRAII